MSRSVLLILGAATLLSHTAFAQVGAPGVYYSGSIAAGDGGQLYPFDRQDPWIHGHFQRIPAYGGYASFRPYNYHHVFSQTQMAQRSGAAHGMPYSQQFWNKYRPTYLNEQLHSPATALMPGNSHPAIPGAAMHGAAIPGAPDPAATFPTGRPVYQTGWTTAQPAQQPVHVYPKR
ncbi:MAG: hypothetical protein KDA96_16885 [Planctomycetaceae bacterium]|nr:hypothetical protein [Planctomycetaceae bacterium]